MDYHSRQEEITYPNITGESWSNKATGEYSGIYHENRTKDLNGVKILYDDIEIPYNIRETSTNLSMANVYFTSGKEYGSTVSYTSTLGIKVPLFFNAHVREDLATPLSKE